MEKAFVISEEHVNRMLAMMETILAKMETMDKVARQPLTRQEAADFLGISLPTLHVLVNEGKIRPIKVGRRTMFDLAEITAFCEGTQKKGHAVR